MVAFNYETLWSAIPYPAFVIKNNNVIANANNSAEIICFNSLKQLIDNCLTKYVGNNSIILNALNQARNELISVALYDVEMHWSGHKPELYDLFAAPINDNGEEILLLLHSQGVSKKMDRSLSHRSAVRSITGMASMLAHEIKNPLAGISGAAQLLSSGLSEKDRELIEIIISESGRIDDLVNRFQNFGDLRPIKVRPINIHNVLDQAKRSASAGYASHVKILVNYDPSLPMVRGDSNLLLQALQNLIKNAAESVPDKGGVITLTTSFKQGLRISLGGDNSENLPLQVTVSDNGAGIPEQLKEEIFEPFVSSKINGTGLGLSVVSKIVSDHGGVIEHSNKSGNTTFTLLLPVWDEKQTYWE